MKFARVWSPALAVTLAVVFAGCEKTPEQKLIKGIKDGDVLMVQQALSENVKLTEAKDGNGRSAAELLKEKKNAQISDMVNEYIKYNTIALGKAQTEEEAKRITAKGISKGIISYDRNFSALHIAVKNRNFVMVKYLVANGFDVDLRGISPPLPTPLTYAVSADDVEMAKLLVSLGASFEPLNVNAQKLIPDYDRGEYDEADYKELIRRTETIVKIGWCDPTKIYQHSKVTKIELNKRDRDGHPVYDCTGKDFVLSLINMGMSPNTRNLEGKTPFAYALEFDEDWANFLIAKGADINDCLVTAVETKDRDNQIRRVKLLLDKGADPNTRIGDKTALGIALKEGNGKIAELLLNKGADPNTRVDDEPALSYALKNNGPGMVKLLLDKGAYPNTRVEDKTVLGYLIVSNFSSIYGDALSDDWFEIMELLLKKGGDPNTKINGINALKYVKLYFLDDNADADSKDDIDQLIFITKLKRNLTARKIAEILKRYGAREE